MAWWFAAPLALWAGKKAYDSIVDEKEPNRTTDISRKSVLEVKTKRDKYRQQMVKDVLNEYRQRLVCELNETQEFYYKAVYNPKAESFNLELSEQNKYLSKLNRGLAELGGSPNEVEELPSVKLKNSDEVVTAVLQSYSENRMMSLRWFDQNFNQEGINSNGEYVPQNDPFNRELVINMEVLSDELAYSADK